MQRAFLYQEEIKILMSELFRTGDLTDDEWTYKYELLKEQSPLEDMGELVQIYVDNGYSVEQGIEVVREMFQKSIDKSKNENV